MYKTLHFLATCLTMGFDAAFVLAVELAQDSVVWVLDNLFFSFFFFFSQFFLCSRLVN